MSRNIIIYLVMIKTYLRRSHRFVATHFNNGDINREIVPLTIKGALFDRDESLKQNLTEARLHRLRPILPNGTVTVGNSCMKNDGAGIALIMEKEMVVAMGIKWGMLYRDRYNRCGSNLIRDRSSTRYFSIIEKAEIKY